MSRPVGLVVLGVGLAALAGWSAIRTGPQIEEDVSARAQAVLADVTRHPVQLSVGGRDILVSGLAHTGQERDLILARLEEVAGRRVVNAELTVLPQIEDYRFTATKNANGELSANGFVADQATADLISDVFGDADVSLGAGEPGPTWGGAVLAGLQGLNVLDEGELTVSEGEIRLSGGPSTPELQVLMENLPVPPEYELALNLAAPSKVEEVEIPFAFAATKAASGQIVVEGSVPDQKTADVVARLDGVSGSVEVLENASNPDWSAQVQTGLAALDQLNTGALNVSEDGVAIKGEAPTQEALDQVQELTLTLPGSIDLAAISVPEIREPQAPAAAPEPQSEGVVPQPADAAQLSYTYDANVGVIVEANMPDGVDYMKVQAAIGAKRVLGNVVMGSGGDAQDLLAQVSRISQWLGEFETAELDLNGAVPKFNGQAFSDVDAQTLGDAMRAENPGFEITVQNSPKSFADGTERTDHISGDLMRRINGFWVPVPEFSVSQNMCQAQVDAVQRAQKLDFQSASSLLTPQSRAGVARLAGIVTKCLETTPFTVSIDGYTDNRGSDENNQKLSNDRAQTVADGLIARGVDTARIDARGYGATNPIASNGTASGRASNRRTEIRIVRP